VLPPLRIEIPKIGVAWPVVLADNDDLPRFRGVGWLMGSAYPGQAGNIVLFGHLDGPYSTFPRLIELKPGDRFSVFTETREHRYLVRGTFETTFDDVSVLIPSDTATATLITCSGHWDPVAQDYSHRLIVKADYKSH
jgi:sortase A